MLNQLDILIGFAVVMAMVSLLITILTQMVSAALGLRGKYLADALEAMIHKIDPTISEQVDELGKDLALGNKLARWVLTHPVLSDSLLLTRPRIWDKFPPLAWLRERWKIASAVRTDELFQVLQDIAGTSPDKAMARQQVLEKVANAARAAIGNEQMRVQLSAEMSEIAQNTLAAEATAKQVAVDAATKAQFTPEPDAKVAAIQRAAHANVVAQEAAKLRIQAMEIADKAEKAIKGVAQARRFADETAMRAAAARILAGLYVPAELDPAIPNIPMIDASGAKQLLEKVGNADA